MKEKIKTKFETKKSFFSKDKKSILGCLIFAFLFFISFFYKIELFSKIFNSNRETIIVLLTLVFFLLFFAILFKIKERNLLGAFLTFFSISIVILFFSFQSFQAEENKIEHLKGVHRYNCILAASLVNGAKEGQYSSSFFFIDPYKENIGFLYNKFKLGLEKKNEDMFYRNLSRMQVVNDHMATNKQFNIMKGTETDYSKYLVLEKQMAIHEQWISDLCEEIKNDFCSEKSIIKF